ncbi:antiviral reverse transcriptase Drt3a [Chromobacterium violaceum]|uniref:antiviral reverse transcriptase Drt3a n=1 Tax=Chromobacterium violaceum TaxID=536 RepID=UPI0009DB1909|nr:antiviral reverse transcriptase Drt3a [Chromobacterium violaceum]QRO31082.1 RNA-directed DNA polymerase [Chromobacterium violaceum]QRQ15001.1 RNA-directed DNA polymerase [Chromobacterium violaceum]
MHKQTYSSENLNRYFLPSDFIGIKKESHKIYKAFVIGMAIKIIDDRTPLIRKIVVKKKPAYTIDDEPYRLLIRMTCANLKSVSKAFLNQSRKRISKNILSFIEEGIPFKIYRLDIKSFFESFSNEEIYEKITEIKKLSPISKDIIFQLINEFKNQGGKGLPRGIGISSVIADILMYNFDDHAKSRPNVFYYARYVDDIIIITRGSEEQSAFVSELSNKLPTGLAFNNKTKFYDIPRIDIKSPNIFDFDFLGYNFSWNAEKYKKQYNSKSYYRKINVNMTKNKVNTIKTRIIRSLIEYTQNHDELLLIDRIKFLTGNFRIFDKKTLVGRMSGIYYNHSLIKNDSKSIQSLDNFIRDILFSKNSRFSKKYSAIIPKKIKRKLLNFSFSNCLNSESFFHFHPIRIREIQRCWNHV